MVAVANTATPNLDIVLSTQDNSFDQMLFTLRSQPVSTIQDMQVSLVVQQGSLSATLNQLQYQKTKIFNTKQKLLGITATQFSKINDIITNVLNPQISTTQDFLSNANSYVTKFSPEENSIDILQSMSSLLQKLVSNVNE